MRGQWTETIAGALVLAAAAAFVVYLMSVGEFQTQAIGYKVSARFGQVGTLAEGADVRVAGVRVGRVTRVTLDPQTYFARAELTVDPAVKLPSDSSATITSDGLLGGAHVAIEPGGAEDMIKPGGEITNTQGAVDLFGLIGQVIKPKDPAPEPAPAGAP